MPPHESQLPADAVFQRMRAYATDLERTLARASGADTSELFVRSVELLEASGLPA